MVASPFCRPTVSGSAFFSGEGLKKVSILGGTPVTLCEVDGFPGGASWGDNGRIVFADDAGVKSVAEAGGEPEMLVAVEGRVLAVLPRCSSWRRGDALRRFHHQLGRDRRHRGSVAYDRRADRRRHGRDAAPLPHLGPRGLRGRWDLAGGALRRRKSGGERGPRAGDRRCRDHGIGPRPSMRCRATARSPMSPAPSSEPRTRWSGWAATGRRRRSRRRHGSTSIRVCRPMARRSLWMCARESRTSGSGMWSARR